MPPAPMYAFADSTRGRISDSAWPVSILTSGSPEASSWSMLRIEIVAGDDRHLHFVGDAQISRQRLDRGTAAERIDAAGIGDDSDAALHARREHIAKMRDEIGRIARRRIAGALFLQDRHRDFGEVVHHQVVDGATFDLSLRGALGSSPQNPPQLAMIVRSHLNSSRAITMRCTSDVPSPISHSFASR